MNKSLINGYFLKRAVCMTLTAIMVIAGTCFGDTGSAGPGGVAASGEAVSAETGIARSAQSWAGLMDNRLEWAEIGGLVEEYSPTVKEERKTYRKNENRLKDAAQTSKALLLAAEEYDSLAIACEGETGGQLAAAEYRLQAEKLREQAADNTGDGRVLLLGMEQAVVKEKKNVKDRFVAWHEAKAAVEDNEAQIPALEKNVRFARARMKAGLTTSTAVTSAETALTAAKNRTPSLAAAEKSAYRDLIVSCGWNYDADAEIGELPGADGMFLSDAETAQGETAALENSFLLREDRIRLENAARLYGESAITQKAAARLASDTEDVRDMYTGIKENLKLAGERYLSAAEDVKMKEKSLSMAKTQYNSGRISEQEYQKKQTALESSGQAQRTALFTLIRARAAYDAVLEGLSL